MFKKNTGELEEQLRKVHPSDIREYQKANQEDLVTDKEGFLLYMNDKLKEKKLQKQEVFLRSDIPLRYGYKLLTEEKVTKQRDVILRICYAAEFTLQETQKALRLYRMDTLYARDPRDALLMTCFNMKQGSLSDLNELLVRNGFEALRSSGKQEEG